MLASVSHYIGNIALLVVFMAFTGIIVPDGRYRRYIDMVLGLVLIFVMLTPIAGWLSAGGAAVNPAEGLAAALQAENDAFPEGFDEDAQGEIVDRSFKSMVKKQVSGQLEPEGFSLEAFDIKYDKESGRIEIMTLALSRREPGDGQTPLIRIEPVTIRPVMGEADREDEAPEIKKVKKNISDFYNLAEDNIYITVRKRGRGE